MYTFDQNFIATFHNNNATNGTVYSDASSNVTFKGNRQVITVIMTFSGNSVTHLGAALLSCNLCYIKTHDSESRGQEEARTRRMSVLFTGSTDVKIVNALNKPPLKLSLS